MGGVSSRMRNRMALSLMLASNAVVGLTVPHHVSPAFAAGVPVLQRLAPPSLGSLATPRTAPDGRASGREILRAGVKQRGPNMLSRGFERANLPGRESLGGEKMGGGLACGQGVRRQQGGRHRTVLTSGEPGFSDRPGFLWLQTAQQDAGLKRVLSWVVFFTVVYLMEPFSGTSLLSCLPPPPPSPMEIPTRCAGALDRCLLLPSLSGA
jgi:hypothetical protein